MATSGESVPQLGIRLLQEEYERQRVILRDRGEEYVASLQKFAGDNPQLAHVAQRLLAQHMGWV